MMSAVPECPRILDIGCGPGMQTVDLLKMSGCQVLALDFWPLMVERTKANAQTANVSGRLEVSGRLGYEQVGHFVLPNSAWTAEYYDPMEDLIAKKVEEWSDIPEAMAVIEGARSEIAMFHNYSSYYGYAFFVMRRPVE